MVFAGFAPHSIADRINDCQMNLVITGDEGVLGCRNIPLKANVDEALKTCPSVKNVIVVKHTGGAVEMKTPRDVWAHALIAKAAPRCEPEEMNAEDPLFISLHIEPPPVNPRACCTPLRAISSMCPLDSPTNTSSIIARAMFTGVRRTWVGSRAIAISSTGHSRTARPRSCSRVSRRTRTVRVSGT